MAEMMVAQGRKAQLLNSTDSPLQTAGEIDFEIFAVKSLVCISNVLYRYNFMAEGQAVLEEAEGVIRTMENDIDEADAQSYVKMESLYY